MTTLKDLAASKFDHALHRKNLNENIEAQLCIAHNGGMFKASPELICFLTCWDTPLIVIEDSFNNPIECDRVKLLDLLKLVYQYAMNAWQKEFVASKNIRSGRNV